MALSRDLAALLASDGNVAALERLYARTVERILRELASGVSRVGAGRARDTLIRIRQLAAQINPRADSQLRDWIRRELPKAFILGDRVAAREVAAALADAGKENVGDVKVNRTFSSINQTTLNTLVAVMSSRMEEVHRQVLQTANLVVRNTQLRAQTNADVRESVTAGIVRGSTGREVSNDIARAILKGKVPPDAVERLQAAGHGGDIELYKALSQGQLITVGKRRFDVRAYANLVARTMSREAATKATVVRLQQSGVDHVQITTTMPTDHDVCTLTAGNVYYIGGGEDPFGFPSFALMPGGGVPLHPHCRHVAVPFVAALKSAPLTNVLRDNVYAAESFFGKDSVEASSRVRELVKAGGVAAVAKYNPRLFGMVPPSRGFVPREAA